MSSENNPNPGISSNNQRGNHNSRGNIRGQRNWRPYYRPWNRSNFNNFVPREKPVTLPIPNASTDPAISGINVNSHSNQPTISFLLDKTPDKYPAWKLYHSQEGL